VRQICSGFDISKEQLQSRSRRRELVIARNTAFFLARKHTDLSLEEIGKRFNRKHSTVIKGIANIEREMNKETPLGRQVVNAVNMVERNGRIIHP
jgi:chromosomal replication initiator protein